MSKSAGNRVMDNLEDFVRVTDTIDAICCALENGEAMPAIPVCNDLMLTDQLGKICEILNHCVKKKESDE